MVDKYGSDGGFSRRTQVLMATLAAGAQSRLPLDADVRAFVAILLVVVLVVLPWTRGRRYGWR